MITGLNFEGFKTFRDRASIAIAPITLVYGSNSSGKSTIIQVLLLMKQTLESVPAPGSALIFNSEQLLNLGNFQNVITDHDLSASFTIGLTLDRVPLSPQLASPKVIRALDHSTLEFTFTADSQDNARLRSLSFFTNEHTQAAFTYKRSNKDISQQELLRRMPSRLATAQRIMKSSRTRPYELHFVGRDNVILHNAFREVSNNLTTQLEREMTDERVRVVLADEISTISNRMPGLLRSLSEFSAMRNGNDPGQHEFLSLGLQRATRDVENLYSMLRDITPSSVHDSRREELVDVLQSLRMLFASATQQTMDDFTGRVDVSPDERRDREMILRHHMFIIQEQLNRLSDTFSKLKTADDWEKRLPNYNIQQFLEDLAEFNADQLLVDRFIPIGCLHDRRNESRLGRLGRLVGAINPKTNRVAATAIPDFGLILNAFGRSIDETMAATTYIGPLREFPKRNYIFSGGGDHSVGLRGENLPNLLHSSEANVQALNRMAKLMGLGYELSIHRSNDPELDDVFALRLKDSITGANVGLIDVGFGVSQVLPVLLECAIASGTGLVAIEQPEIHLNPRLQASLGDVFAETVKRGKARFLIETHSEHLLLRLQNLIRRGSLDASCLSVVYVSKDAHGSSILPIEISDEGERLTPWPSGFFDDTFRELFDIDRRP